MTDITTDKTHHISCKITTAKTDELSNNVMNQDTMTLITIECISIHTYMAHPILIMDMMLLLGPPIQSVRNNSVTTSAKQS